MVSSKIPGPVINLIKKTNIIFEYGLKLFAQNIFFLHHES